MLIVLAAILLATPIQQAGEPAPSTTAAPADAAAPAEAKPASKSKRKMVCETVQEIGTRLGGRRVCYDPTQKRDGEDDVRRSMNRTH